MFRNREDAGFKLAKALCGRQFADPLVLGVPRGGVVIGAILAKHLGAELDVILSQRLQDPCRADGTIGAVTADGFIFLDPQSSQAHCEPDGYLAEERRRQMSVMASREQRVRQVCPRTSIFDRTVIVTDDGIITGSTMIAALQAIRPLKPRKLIVAVPLAAAERMEDIRQWCDELLVLRTPTGSFSLSQFYEDFTEVSDKQMLRLLGQKGGGHEESPQGLAATIRF